MHAYLNGGHPYIKDKSPNGLPIQSVKMSSM